MEKFIRAHGLVAPLDRANVDTDAIIPKQFLKSIKRTGFGPNLFDAWRYLDHGEPGMDNSKRPLESGLRAEPAALPGRVDPARAQELRLRLARASTRRGRCSSTASARSIAPSFADIFFNNCFKNGLLPIVLRRERTSTGCSTRSAAFPGYRLADRPRRADRRHAGRRIALPFDIEPFRKHCLLNGFDDIGLTLRHADKIRAFEERKRRDQQPWLAHTI